MSKPSLDNKSSVLSHAELEWRENGQPASTLFEDIYFSTASGIDETRHVFLNANQLTERFQALSHNQVFTIGETGFGTGLNFLCAWQHFEQHAPESAQLHFISTEKFPLNAADLKRSLTIWPELSTYSEALTRCRFSACCGHQHVKFADGRIRLTMLMGDALDTLPKLDGYVDAWFLDGFSPSRNPDMWQPALFQAMAQKSHSETTYATFTAARSVRDGLSEAGFSVEKSSGFGHKRDMIKGRFNAEQTFTSNRLVWFQDSPSSTKERKTIVVGGGLSGCSTARALAERGWQVTLLEQHSNLASEASGNPQGIFYSKLSANQTPLSRFIVQGYLYSINLLNSLNPSTAKLWSPSGVIQLAIDAKTQKRHRELAEHFPADILEYHDKDRLSRLSGIQLDYDGLHFPAAGWVKPPELCKAMADHPDINIQSNRKLLKLDKNADGWSLTAINPVDHSKTFYQSSHVVIACATATQQVEPLRFLPLKSIRGQISRVAATEQSRSLSTTVCGEGYAAPAINGFHTIGATFDFHNDSSEVLIEDHQTNLSMQAQWVPDFYQAIGGENTNILDGRTSFRCTTPDYLPMVGKVIDHERFLEDFSMLRKNVKYHFTAPPQYHEGLYINAGHGSRGLITCPLSGEILAAMMNNECAAIPADLKDSLNPARFLVRAMSRNQI